MWKVYFHMSWHIDWRFWVTLNCTHEFLCISRIFNVSYVFQFVPSPSTSVFYSGRVTTLAVNGTFYWNCIHFTALYRRRTAVTSIPFTMFPVVICVTYTVTYIFLKKDNITTLNKQFNLKMVIQKHPKLMHNIWASSVCFHPCSLIRAFVFIYWKVS